MAFSPNAEKILEYLYTRQDGIYHDLSEMLKKSNPRISEHDSKIAMDELGDYVEKSPVFIGAEQKIKARLSESGRKYYEDRISRSTDQNLKKKDIKVRWWQVIVPVILLALGYYINTVLIDNLPLKIIEIDAEYQLVRLTIKNENSDPRYIREIKIKLFDRDSLKGMISPHFSQPPFNEIIHQQLSLQNEYLIRPKMYLPKESIETFPFNLFHRHEDPQREFMKLVFEITDDKGLTTVSDTVYHFVGFEEINEYRDSVDSKKYRAGNDRIVEKVRRSRLWKSGIVEEVLRKN